MKTFNGKKTRALFHHILYCKQVHTDYTKHVDNSYVQNHLRRKTQKLDYIHNIFVYAAVHFNFISGLEYCLVLNNFKSCYTAILLIKGIINTAIVIKNILGLVLPISQIKSK